MRILPLLVAALVYALALGCCHADETCNAPELVEGKTLPALTAAHAERCRATAVDLLQSIRDDGLSCSEVVTYSLTVGHGTRMTVACRVYGSGIFSHYVSINGDKFAED